MATRTPSPFFGLRQPTILKAGSGIRFFGHCEGQFNMDKCPSLTPNWGSNDAPFPMQADVQLRFPVDGRSDGAEIER